MIDDHSRIAHTEVHDGETPVTALTVLHRTVKWFVDRGVTIERVLSDNGGAYRSRRWRDTCEAMAITPKRTRPYRPRANGKVERFHRSQADGWAYDHYYAWSKNAGTPFMDGSTATSNTARTPRARFSHPSQG